MKAVVVLNDITHAIEHVQIIQEDLMHVQHIALRINNHRGFSLLFLDIKNNVVPDPDKNNIIIYDAGYADKGFHPAVVYENKEDVLLKDYYDVVSPLVINDMIKYFGVDKSKMLLNAIGIAELRTNSKAKVDLFLKNLQENMLKEFSQPANKLVT